MAPRPGDDDGDEGRKRSSSLLNRSKIDALMEENEREKEEEERQMLKMKKKSVVDPLLSQSILMAEVRVKKHEMMLLTVILFHS